MAEIDNSTEPKNEGTPQGDDVAAAGASAEPLSGSETLNEGAAALLDKLSEKNQELDVEEVDQFLSTQDPDFSSNIGDIAKDKTLKAAEISDLEGDAQLLFEETQKWVQSKGLWRIVFRLFPAAPNVSLAVRKLAFRFSRQVRATWILLKNEGNDLAVRTWKGTVSGSKAFAQNLKEKLAQLSNDYRNLPTKRKVVLLLLNVGAALAIGGIYLALTGKIIPQERQLFVTDMADVATKSYEFEANAEKELFYDNLRSAANLLIIPKILANIKVSSQSGPNPMVAVEFFAEGFTPEVLLEMKEREAMVRDTAQRAVEDFSFDELDSPDGKLKLTQVVSRELNRILGRGQIKSLKIKTIVLKP